MIPIWWTSGRARTRQGVTLCHWRHGVTCDCLWCVAVFNVPRSRGPSGLQGLPSSKPRPENQELDSNSPSVPSAWLISFLFQIGAWFKVILADSHSLNVFVGAFYLQFWFPAFCLLNGNGNQNKVKVTRFDWAISPPWLPPNQAAKDTPVPLSPAAKKSMCVSCSRKILMRQIKHWK